MSTSFPSCKVPAQCAVGPVAHLICRLRCSGLQPSHAEHPVAGRLPAWRQEPVRRACGSLADLRRPHPHPGARPKRRFLRHAATKTAWQSASRSPASAVSRMLGPPSVQTPFSRMLHALALLGTSPRQVSAGGTWHAAEACCWKAREWQAACARATCIMQCRGPLHAARCSINGQANAGLCDPDG